MYTQEKTDAELCADVERAALDRWGGEDAIELARRYRETLMRARLRAVVEKHKAQWYHPLLDGDETPRERLARNRVWRDTR